MDNIIFEFDKLSKKEKQGYLSMTDKQKEAYEKKWLSLQQAKAEMDLKISQATQRAKAKAAREKEAQRKADTHRKIENGALLEAFLKNNNAEFLIYKENDQKENQKLKEFLEYCFKTPYVKKKIEELKGGNF